MSTTSLQAGEFVPVFYRGQKANGFSKRVLAGGRIAYYQRLARNGARNARREPRPDITTDAEALKASGKSVNASKKERRNRTKKMKVDQFFTDKAFPHFQKKLGVRTAKGYRSTYNVHIKPVLGDEWVRDVDEDMIVECRDSLLTKTYTKGGVTKPYLPQTRYNVQVALGAIFQLAKDLGYRDDNPVRELPETLKETMPDLREVSEREVYTLAEMKLMREQPKDERMKMMLTLAPEVGFRTSEMCGIKLECIDWDEGCIHVQWQLVDNSATEIGPLKWAKVIGQKSRKVYPRPATMAKLKEYVTWTKTQPWSFKNKEHWLFPTNRGNAMTACFAANKVQEIVAAVGIDRPMDFHCYRHTFVSHLADEGFNDSDIGRLIGDSPTVVAKTYKHFINEDKFADRTREALRLAYAA